MKDGGIKKILFFGVMFFAFLMLKQPFSYALEWKEIHEEADKTGVSGALTQLGEAPNSPAKLYLLGLVYLNAHRDKEAGEVFKEMLVLDSESIEAEWGKAEVLRRQYKLKESEKILTRIIESEPDFSPAYISLAYIKYTNMAFKESAKLAYEVLKKERENTDLSNYTRAHLIFAGAKGMIAHYGGLLAKLMHGSQVYPNLKKAETLQPDSAAVLFGLGSFYFLAPSAAGGDLDKAYTYLKRAVEIDPLFSDAYVRLAQVYKLRGENDKYELYLNKALEIEPDNVLAMDEKSGKCSFICVSDR